MTSAFSLNYRMTSAFGLNCRMASAFSLNCRMTSAFGLNCRMASAFGLNCRMASAFGLIVVIARLDRAIQLSAAAMGADSESGSRFQYLDPPVKPGDDDNFTFFSTSR